MNRKNAFSYLMWFVYSITVCVGLLGIAGVLSRRAGYSEVVGFVVIGLWFVVCGLIVFLMHRLVENMNSEKLSRIPALVAESLIVIVLFAVGLVLRIGGLFNAGDDAAYYELAKIAEGQTIPSVVHGAVYIYLQLLHLVYFIFGNHFLAGIWLQIILQMIAGFFFYRAVRKMAGVVASLITLGFIMIGPLMVSESLSLSPRMLFLAIYAIVLYICIRCISGKKGMIACSITGMMISVVCYLDIMGVTLLLITIAGLLLKKYKIDCSISKRLVGMLLCVVGCGLGFVLLILADSLASADRFANVIAAWWKLYCPSRFMIPDTLEIANITVDILFLLLIMAFGVFSYWCSFRREHQSIWVWQAILLVVLQCFNMTTTELNGYLHLYIVFAVLAGVSVANMLFTKEESSQVFDYLEKVAELDIKEIEVKELDEKEVNETESVESEAVMVESTGEPKTEEPKVQLLENPLPLPKKHVKKVLDFDRDFGEDQNDYDLKVDDNDDFDI